MKSNSKYLIEIIFLIGVICFLIFGIIISPESWRYKSGIRIETIAMTEDGTYFIASGYSSGQNSKVFFFSNDSSDPIWIFNTTEDINSVDISSNGNYAVAGGDDNLYLFSKESQTPLWIYNLNSSVNSVSISSDGQYIIA